MHIENHKSLKEFNTFGIDCKASHFVSVSSISELKEVLKAPQFKDPFILGGGSNILLTQDVDRPVIHVNLKGISEISETDNHIVLQVMAGENWHELVQYCLSKDYGGIENLSLIPGNTGTAPIQNIGAYGVELKDVFDSCTALNLESLEETVFSKADCKFEYRNSIFKQELKGKVIITSVNLRLTKNNHTLHTSYGAIQQMLEDSKITNPTIQDISEVVIAIRSSKLPDPKELGNSGSFFKNPVLNAEDFQNFRLQNPEAPFYEISATEFKIPAGWLIEKAGFKGKRFGEAGVHEKQALVLVNYGNAKGEEIWNLAQLIQSKVKEQFGIYIEPEVNVI
ncbi:MAG: UDP-N-acetylmuramate dehydrogenase [Flavobacteriaceae bacterium]|nr:UDP-N-acetylmuramate dehydrogenase [Flavobacteriaceae bacterium]